MFGKRALFFAFLLLSFILLSHNLLAQLDENPLEDDIDKLEETKETLSDEDVRSSYLKQEWTKFLSKTKFGEFLISAGELMKALDPVFILLIGVNYSLSWFFFLSLIFGAAIVFILYKPMKIFLDINPLLAIFISLIILALISRAKGIQIVVEFFAPVFGNNLLIILSLFVFLALLVGFQVIMRILSKRFREYEKKERERRKEILEDAVSKQNEMRLRKGI